jgi:hypothetical protein
MTLQPRRVKPKHLRQSEEIIARTLALLSTHGTKIDFGTGIPPHTVLDLDGLHLEDNQYCTEVLWKLIPDVSVNNVTIVDPVRKTVVRRFKKTKEPDFTSNLNLLGPALKVLKRHMVLDDIAGI